MKPFRNEPLTRKKLSPIYPTYPATKLQLSNSLLTKLHPDKSHRTKTLPDHDTT